jgi:2'-5' RNA ligase
MTKLFVALELPVSATAALTAIQPPAAPGIRLVEPGQMHLTLHFLARWTSSGRPPRWGR